MRDRDEKLKLIEELSRTSVVSLACKKSGISRASYYRWLEEDSWFERQCNKASRQGRELMCDKAESNILKAVSDGDLKVSTYYLEHNHPNYKKGNPPFNNPDRITGLLDMVKSQIESRNKSEQEENIDPKDTSG
jgi:hypothetical protein